MPRPLPPTNYFNLEEIHFLIGEIHFHLENLKEIRFHLEEICFRLKEIHFLIREIHFQGGWRYKGLQTDRFDDLLFRRIPSRTCWDSRHEFLDNIPYHVESIAERYFLAEESLIYHATFLSLLMSNTISAVTSGFNSDQVTHARTEQFACVVDASNPWFQSKYSFARNFCKMRLFEWLSNTVTRA